MNKKILINILVLAIVFVFMGQSKAEAAVTLTETRAPTFTCTPSANTCTFDYRVDWSGNDFATGANLTYQIFINRNGGSTVYNSGESPDNNSETGTFEKINETVPVNFQNASSMNFILIIKCKAGREFACPTPAPIGDGGFYTHTLSYSLLFDNVFSMDGSVLSAYCAEDGTSLTSRARFNWNDFFATNPNGKIAGRLDVTGATDSQGNPLFQVFTIVAATDNNPTNSMEETFSKSGLSIPPNSNVTFNWSFTCKDPGDGEGVCNGVNTINLPATSCGTNAEDIEMSLDMGTNSGGPISCQTLPISLNPVASWSGNTGGAYTLTYSSSVSYTDETAGPQTVVSTPPPSTAESCTGCAMNLATSATPVIGSLVSFTATLECDENAPNTTCPASITKTASCRAGEGNINEGDPTRNSIDFGLNFGDATFKDTSKSLFQIMYPIGIGFGAAYIARAGYTIATSDGNPQKIQAGKDDLTAAIAGTIFIFMSMTMLRLIVNVLLGPAVII